MAFVNFLKLQLPLCLQLLGCALLELVGIIIAVVTLHADHVWAKYKQKGHDECKRDDDCDDVLPVDRHLELVLGMAPSQIQGLPSYLKLDAGTQRLTGFVTDSGDARHQIQITFAPTIEFEGDDFCSLKSINISLNIAQVDSSLPGFLMDTVVNFLNEDQALKNKVLGKINDTLSEYMDDSCSSQGTTIIAVTPFPDPEGLKEQLRQKYEFYLASSKGMLDEKMWLKESHCDGLLFNSLYSIAGGETDVSHAQDPNVPGKFYRHWHQTCYQNHLQGLSPSSKSTISRDMMMGLFHWILSNNRSDLVDNLINYGRQRTFMGFPLLWIVGEGQLGRVDLRPGNVQNLYDLREKMTGSASPLADVDLQTYLDCAGYECHLTALNIFLRYRVDGALPVAAMDRLEKLADQNPKNALYNGLYGKIRGSHIHTERALRLLLDPQWFPKERLPNSADRCSEYLYQRDYLKDGAISANYLPCPEEQKEHSGLDLIFSAAVILDLIP